jgi:hypothetical protein
MPFDKYQKPAAADTGIETANCLPMKINSNQGK